MKNVLGPDRHPKPAVKFGTGPTPHRSSRAVPPGQVRNRTAAGCSRSTSKPTTPKQQQSPAGQVRNRTDPFRNQTAETPRWSSVQFETGLGPLQWLPSRSDSKPDWLACRSRSKPVRPPRSRKTDWRDPVPFETGLVPEASACLRGTKKYGGLPPAPAVHPKGGGGEGEKEGGGGRRGGG